MSGHSKWSQIKHQKGTADARRSNLFSKLANAIAIAARSGADPASNFQLRLTIEKAKAANMPKANIERAIARGSGKEGGPGLEEILYEAYGPGGTAILIEAVTDNRNRTTSEVKSVLSRLGTKLAEAGGVKYLFEKKGEVKIHANSRELGRESTREKEEAELAIIESGAEDYQAVEKGYLIYAVPTELNQVKNNLENAGFTVEEIGFSWEPKQPVSVDETTREKIVKLLLGLEELEDVTAVHSNFS